MENETRAEKQVPYFSHYFREWGGKIGALHTYQNHVNDNTTGGRELLGLANRMLKTPVRTFEERIGKNYPGEVEATRAEFSEEIKAINGLVHKYNSSYIDFREGPDFDGIGKLAAEADIIKKEAYRTRGL